MAKTTLGDICVELMKNKIIALTPNNQNWKWGNLPSTSLLKELKIIQIGPEALLKGFIYHVYLVGTTSDAPLTSTSLPSLDGNSYHLFYGVIDPGTDAQFYLYIPESKDKSYNWDILVESLRYNNIEEQITKIAHSFKNWLPY